MPGSGRDCRFSRVNVIWPRAFRGPFYCNHTKQSPEEKPYSLPFTTLFHLPEWRGHNNLLKVRRQRRNLNSKSAACFRVNSPLNNQSESRPVCTLLIVSMVLWNCRAEDTLGRAHLISLSNAQVKEWKPGEVRGLVITEPWLKVDLLLASAWLVYFTPGYFSHSSELKS